MIYVKRVVKPGVLVRNGKKWTKDILNATSVADRVKAVNKYQHDEIKDTLVDMFHGKCAYCESYIAKVDYGDIEHYKPKRKFPKLAVAWDNLLLSCAKCNGMGQKGDQWPKANDGGPLVNPCKEKPEKFFSFIFDKATFVSIVKPLNTRGNTSEKIYGLNKHVLVKDRNIFVRKLIYIAKDYHANPEAKSILDEAVKDDGEYAAFARMVKAIYT